MDAGDWIAVVAAIIAGIVGYFAYVSAQAGRASAEAGRESARAAAKAADEAAKLSEIERERRQEEREARHEQLAPRTPSEIVGELETGLTGPSLFGWISVPDRDYRVSAHAISGRSSTPIGLPLLIRANQPQRIHVEHWPEGRTKPQTEEILVKFWPPIADADLKAPWACSCGRPSGETTDNEPHWERRIRVTYDPPPNLH